MTAKKATSAALLSPAHVAQQIYLIRGQKVMLDADLAALYGIETFHVNKAVKRTVQMNILIIRAFVRLHELLALVFVIPAKAGIHVSPWRIADTGIPAFAGMTME